MERVDIREKKRYTENELRRVERMERMGLGGERVERVANKEKIGR
jgi:hypothetical protein